MHIGIVHVLMRSFIGVAPWVMLMFLLRICVVHMMRRRTVSIIAESIMVIMPWAFTALLLRVFGAKSMTSMTFLC